LLWIKIAWIKSHEKKIIPKLFHWKRSLNYNGQILNYLKIPLRAPSLSKGKVPLP
jgi:hypothetical protein